MFGGGRFCFSDEEFSEFSQGSIFTRANSLELRSSIIKIAVLIEVSFRSYIFSSRDLWVASIKRNCALILLRIDLIIWTRYDIGAKEWLLCVFKVVVK